MSLQQVEAVKNVRGVAIVGLKEKLNARLLKIDLAVLYVWRAESLYHNKLIRFVADDKMVMSPWSEGKLRIT